MVGHRFCIKGADLPSGEAAGFLSSGGYGEATAEVGPVRRDKTYLVTMRAPNRADLAKMVGAFRAYAGDHHAIASDQPLK